MKVYVSEPVLVEDYASARKCLAGVAELYPLARGATRFFVTVVWSASETGTTTFAEYYCLSDRW